MNNLGFSYLFTVLVLVATTFPSHAEIYLNAKAGSGTIEEWPHIVIEGRISEDDAIIAANILDVASRKADLRHADGSPLVFVLLNSLGGDVSAAISIGRLFRKKTVETWILPGATCSSSCVYIFASGVKRSVAPGGRIGLHRPTFKDFKTFAKLELGAATSTYQKMATETQSYFSDMGIPRNVVDKMMSVSSDKIIFIGWEEAEKMLLAGEDPAFAEWDRARSKVKHGEDWVNKLDNLVECYNELIGNGTNTDDVLEYCKRRVGLVE